jgi:hypothetical protein
MDHLDERGSHHRWVRNAHHTWHGITAVLDDASTRHAAKTRSDVLMQLPDRVRIQSCQRRTEARDLMGARFAPAARWERYGAKLPEPAPKIQPSRELWMSPQPSGGAEHLSGDGLQGCTADCETQRPCTASEALLCAVTIHMGL